MTMARTLQVGGLAVTVSRNHFGRQLNSFESDLTCTSSSIAAENRNIAKGVFIRAPAILSVDSPDVQVLATLKYKDQPIQPVAVQQGKLMGLSFHPELTDDARWHKAFLHMVLQDRQKRAAAAQS
jgi:5'-phosphate synthase pdxT subunit